jgi:hypothetical protein
VEATLWASGLEHLLAQFQSKAPPPLGEVGVARHRLG